MATTPYKAPERVFTKPTWLVVVHTPWYNDVPVRHIALERRTGSVRVFYSSALTIQSSETGDVYPHGASIEVQPGCEVGLEVLRRGLSDADYRRLTVQPLYLSSLHRAQRLPMATPLVASSECFVGNMGTSMNDRMRLVPGNNLTRYLRALARVLVTLFGRRPALAAARAVARGWR